MLCIVFLWLSEVQLSLENAMTESKQEEIALWVVLVVLMSIPWLAF